MRKEAFEADWQKQARVEKARASFGRNLSAHDAAMAEAYGYRRAKRDACPKTVAGKRCTRFSGSGWPRCICEAHDRLLDHARSWTDAAGARVLTAEPYHVDPARLAAFERDCAALGLVVEVGGVSPWYPGSTTLITVRAKP